MRLSAIHPVRISMSKPLVLMYNTNEGRSLSIHYGGKWNGWWRDEAQTAQDEPWGVSGSDWCAGATERHQHGAVLWQFQDARRLLISGKVQQESGMAADIRKRISAGYFSKSEASTEVSFLELVTWHYAKSCKRVALQGFTGSGKTYLVCAMEKQACLSQIKTRYIRLPDMLAEYDESSLAYGRSKKTIDKYAGILLLITDEWLVGEVSAKESHFLFELMLHRSDSTSTIFCTQYKKWSRGLEGKLKPRP